MAEVKPENRREVRNEGRVRAHEIPLTTQGFKFEVASPDEPKIGRYPSIAVLTLVLLIRTAPFDLLLASSAHPDDREASFKPETKGSRPPNQP